MTILEGVLEGTGKHIFAAVPTRQPGIKFAVSGNEGDRPSITAQLTK